MPTTSKFPVTATVGNSGDVYSNGINPQAVIPVDSNQLWAGDDGTAKIPFSYLAFLRFEIDIPEDAVITGVALKIYGTGTNSALTWDMLVGILNPAHAQAEYMGAGGFETTTNYPYMDQLPRAQMNRGGTTDDTVWWESTAPDVYSHTGGNAFSNHTVWEGTQSGTYEHTSFLDSLISYWGDATNQSTYLDTGVGDGLPIGISILGDPPHTAIDNVQKYGSKNAGGFFFPQLWVDWYLPGDAELTSSATIDADGTIESGVDHVGAAELAVSAALDAEGTATDFAAAEMSVTATLDAEGFFTEIGASELSVSAVLDANLRNFFLGITPINITRPSAAVELTRVGATTEITRVSASAEITRPGATTEITRPGATTEITRPSATATIQRQPDVS